ncbi:hypothetical protein Ava_B0305 (plasmid) [Trichormus variabilis ATCC 29413]|uniref:PLD phosphodiesterase domain-containing protein n=3 Tax=Anabaena variabilis TaxID=264691 RepID=Q3M1X1_TRIV2|nr:MULTISPECIES: phospholipase D family protein [Nostocaceae]ABA25015.1 hypothetical protein Ava_B0305 [Trichormus variabilis ATCC 29413]MBC1217843.1 phospholipase D family protein [Trichormus variabilis ARAD]MBC1259264.1 phospholipase D family protein [Trichormus variabilis V5]MBC1270697.1 phospholipase D family protein [Trichormus variabilis FSR]MBC1305773.1 phospholipase D family protein [Trichormus variabilis N2B]
MILPAIQLEKLCAEAHKDILLAAPFIKVSVLERLFLKISNDVKVKCITRWHPEEILAGVSDLEVWNIIKARPNCSLWLKHNLHAKFYRADEECLVGSANLTASALGWSNHPNFEILVVLPATYNNLKTFEAELLAGCIQIDDGLFEQMSITIEILKNHHLQQLPLPTVEVKESSFENLAQAQAKINYWLPTLRNPEDLYLAYSGQLEKLTTISRKAALLDIHTLPLTPNLPKDAFESYLGLILLEMPIIQQVDEFIATPKRFGAVRDFLSSLPCATVPDFNAEHAWQTLMRWLRYFLPKRYILFTPNHSEIFYRVQRSS